MMRPLKKKTPSTKLGQQSGISSWLKRETPQQIRALETASRHFDRNDTLDVHTLEAVYAQESSFGEDRGKRNSVGAAGDFQIKRSVARKVGLKVSAINDERFDIGASSAAAAKILETSDGYFRKPTVLDKNTKTIPIVDAEERKKFALAAYNAGNARIAKAQKWALEAGEDPTDWGSVKKFLEKAGASKRQADETRQYVDKISGYEREFDRKSKADAEEKYRKGKPIDPYPQGGHWITKDGRHIFIKD